MFLEIDFRDSKRDSGSVGRLLCEEAETAVEEEAERTDIRVERGERRVG
jgi:hypothetical protein